jgi:spermidine synthase
MASSGSARFSGWLPAFFVVSGFCSLVDQVVWLRLTMAHFGVTTPMVSILLSVFMAGLALGSWAAGAASRRFGLRSSQSALRLYGLSELVISLSLFAVPPGLDFARHAMVRSGAWNSAAYYLGAGAWTTALLLPFGLAMGATLPFAMSVIRAERGPDWPRSFSRLYVANVVGAVLGTALSALAMIEMFGFHGTLEVAASLNATLAASAFGLSLRSPAEGSAAESPSPAAPAAPILGTGRGRAYAILFATGFASLGMEVVWIRQLTPYLGNLVYSFAIILCVYLSASFVGSALYRKFGRSVPASALSSIWPWAVLGVACVLPALLSDPRLGAPASLWNGTARAAFGIGPFCLLVGFVTPLVVDRLTGGDPALAGSAYAVNVVGCILGPLFAGFVLVPRVAESWALLLFGICLMAFGVWTGPARTPGRPLLQRVGRVAVGAAVAIGLVTFSRSFESVIPGAVVLRDSTATVTAMGTGLKKRLLINGIGMTVLTPITKMMAHLPLALLDHPPTSALVVCFGMGTTFRSMRTWGISTTAVELVPSVPRLFAFYHADGPAIARQPGARIVIDDGRRFLEYDPEEYDVIAIDPPPPIHAAGSSLLYSREFYSAARRRLRPDGIVAQWVPGGDAVDLSSVTRAFAQSFRYVRIFRSISGGGLHLLGSDAPIQVPSAAALAGRLPPAAREDLVEWGPQRRPERMLGIVLAREVPIGQILQLAPQAPPLTDDDPVNEYFLLRLARERFRTRFVAPAASAR